MGTTTTSTFAVLPDGAPPFFRGEQGEWDATICDYLGPEFEGDACDAQAAYLIHWKPVPKHDLDTLPCSGVCAAHAVGVDRNLVESISTHPSLRPASSS